MAQLTPRAIFFGIKRRLARIYQDTRAYWHYTNVNYRNINAFDFVSSNNAGGLLAQSKNILRNTPLSLYIDDVQREIAKESENFKRYVKISDELVNGNINVYDRKVELGDQLDWNIDITGRGVWPNIFFKRYRRLVTGQVGNFGDFRFTWELNRQQHLLGLSVAYKITSDERYSNCIIEHILTWIKTNPPFKSLNWISSMEIGLRLVSWSLSLSRICGKSMDPRSEKAILASIYQQICFLSENLSFDLRDQGGDTKLKNNHSIVELSSLLIVCELFPQLAEAAGVTYRKKDLWKSLINELSRQTYPDGMHVEQASSYLRFVAEALLLTRMIVPDTDALDEYINHYIRALMAFRYDDEKIIIIGDEDNGHVLLPFYDSKPDSIKVVLGMYERKNFSQNRVEDLALIPHCWQKIVNSCSVLKDSGHWISRFANNDINFSVYFRSGRMDFPSIPGYAPHAHCDLLSLNLIVENQLWLLDRGTYSYHQRSVADKLRCSAAHNTILVDGFEQMRLLGAFNSDGHARGEMMEASRLGVSGKMTLQKNGRSIVVTRTIKVHSDEANIVVHDKISGLAGEQVFWMLNLHPDIRIDDSGLLERAGTKRRVQLEGWEGAKMREVPYSSRYGVIEQSAQLVLGLSSKNAGMVEKQWSIRICT